MKRIYGIAVQIFLLIILLLAGCDRASLEPGSDDGAYYYRGLVDRESYIAAPDAKLKADGELTVWGVKEGEDFTGEDLTFSIPDFSGPGEFRKDVIDFAIWRKWSYDMILNYGRFMTTADESIIITSYDEERHEIEGTINMNLQIAPSDTAVYVQDVEFRAFVRE